MRKYFNTNGDPITFNGRAIMVGDTIRVWFNGQEMEYTINDRMNLELLKSNYQVYDKVELLNR